MRVLIVAKRELRRATMRRLELTPLGILGIHDAARAGVAESVEEAREAGVRTVMITGDHPGTALAIARETRVVDEDDTRASSPEPSSTSYRTTSSWRAARRWGSMRASFRATRSASLTRCDAAARWWR